MKKFNWFVGFTFFFVCFLLTPQDVFAIRTTGGFSCTYDIKYKNVTGQDDHSNLIISYGTYEGSNGNEALKAKFVDSSATVNSSVGLAYFSAQPENATKFSYNRLNIAKFYDSSSDSWVCPKVRYVVFGTNDTASPYILFLYPGNGEDDIKAYNSNAALAPGGNNTYGGFGEVDAIDSSINNSDTQASGGDNIFTCSPVKSNNDVEIVMEINRNTNVASFTVNGQKANEITNFTIGCSDDMTSVLKFCEHPNAKTNNHHNDVVAYGKTCEEFLKEHGYDTSQYTSYETKFATDAKGEIIMNNNLTSISWDSLGEDISLNCNDKDVKALMDDLTRYYRIVEVITPILIVLLGSIDLTGGILNQDKDAMQKSIQKFVKRCIAGLAIYFLPLIIEVLFSFPGLPDAEDILCGIAMIIR